MQSAIVTRDNARVLLMQTEETMRQGEYLDQLHDKADNYLHQLDTQRIILLLACGVIVLLLVVFVLFYLYYLGKVNLRRERVVNTLWNMKPEETPTASFFISRFKEVIEARLENSELSVEDLAADMNLSRVQLYRKVKSITGSTPVELLRTARLNRAYQLLLTSDRSVSEVAYLVGFTAPSYFTKCFKEEYGMLPGEVRNQ
jgi:AraC-like DNA-binding protein